MGFNIIKKFKKAVSDYKDNQEKLRAEEEARKNKILSGQIDPIQIDVNLEKDEKAYFVANADRMATVDRIVEYTEGKSKKKGVLGRAVVGGFLLGPLGAVGGAATAGSEHKSQTMQKTVSNTEKIDSGRMFFTNRRIIFMGNNIISLDYKKLFSVEFPRSYKMIIKYEGMQNGEHFVLSGSNTSDTLLYYKGITNNLLK